MVTMARTLVLVAVALLMLLGLATADLPGSKPERSLFLDMSGRDLFGTPSTVDGGAFYNTGNMEVQTRRMLRRPTPGQRPPPPKAPKIVKKKALPPPSL